MVCNRVTDSPVNHLDAAMGGRAQPSRSSFPRGMALLVAGAFFMEILDATIIAPAIPRVGSSLGAQPTVDEIEPQPALHRAPLTPLELNEHIALTDATNMHPVVGRSSQNRAS
jgi:hypothetical protein